ncbi:DUF2868 domain-containing protein [Brachymonas sp. G13]|uniref:DUF2868 domain-containing protein n=1 Tax=Brachymonas wangyanguii TaxID=3130163 RepID=UPI00307E02D1
MSLPHSRLQQFSTAQAIQLLEANGPLDDAQALRQAHRQSTDRGTRVLWRAWLLGARLGLPEAWQHWRSSAGWVMLGLAVLMLLSSWGAAQTVLGQGRSINAVAAFVSLLGSHLLMLLLWLLGLVLLRKPQGGALLGTLAMRLTARLPLQRGPQAAALFQGLTRTLQQQRIGSWFYGAISHGIWALCFVLMLLALWFGFSFHAYRLSWETTILSDDFFRGFVHLTGWLPAQLGFPLPDAASVHAAGLGEGGDQRAWAWWLMGCVVVYGLIPRLLLAVLCLLAWRWAQSRLQVDLSDPYVRRLLARFEALDPPPEVIDPERAAPLQSSRYTHDPAAAPGEPALIGFELPPDWSWSPASLQPDDRCWQQNLSGSSEERAALLQKVQELHPARLLVAVWAGSSPDRGTARLLRDLQAASGATLALWLQGPQATDAQAQQRWQQWLQASELQAPVWSQDAQALAWLRQPVAANSGENA